MNIKNAESPLPRELGFSMPAEFAPHAATWIAWPHNRRDWPDKFAPVPWVYAEIVRLLAAREPVRILVADAKEKFQAEQMLLFNNANLGNVQCDVCPTDRVWLRDSGCIFLTAQANAGREIAACGFRFNGWAKYEDHRADQKVPAFMARKTKARLFKPVAERQTGKPLPFVLEGGGIDVNGTGCLLTTEECLLSETQQRNPGLDRESVEATLCDWLGVEKILWLDRGIAGDDTHGHIDDIARFTDPQTIVACVEEKPFDANHSALAENLRRLKLMRDTRGRQFNIVELPMPDPVLFQGQRLPASYANFYIANEQVLVPVFNDRHDSAALGILESCFADRTIHPVYCRDLVWGLGTLHCLTQQQPR